ncbi:MAG: hypothetical protein HY228_00270 [Candidatus Yonathbacteria bacterium]|nr:hypothetical protein [Candidatus Yonathbacteria bacterium]
MPEKQPPLKGPPVLSEEEIRRMTAEAGKSHLTDPEPDVPTFSEEEIREMTETPEGEFDFSGKEGVVKDVVNKKREGVKKEEGISKDFKILTNERFLHLLLPIIWTLTLRGITNNPDEKFDSAFIDQIAKDASEQLFKSIGFYLRDSQMKYVADELYKTLEVRKQTLVPFTPSFIRFFEKVFHYIPREFSGWKEEDSSQ